MAFIMTLWIGNGAVPVNSNSKNFENKQFMAEIIQFSKFFSLPLTATYKNCTFTYP